VGVFFEWNLVTPKGSEMPCVGSNQAGGETFAIVSEKAFAKPSHKPGKNGALSLGKARYPQSFEKGIRSKGGVQKKCGARTKLACRVINFYRASRVKSGEEVAQGWGGRFKTVAAEIATAYSRGGEAHRVIMSHNGGLTQIGVHEGVTVNRQKKSSDPSVGGEEQVFSLRGRVAQLPRATRSRPGRRVTRGETKSQPLGFAITGKGEASRGDCVQKNTLNQRG